MKVEKTDRSKWMTDKMERSLQRLFYWARIKTKGVEKDEPAEEGNLMKVLKKGSAMRVIFFYPGEEGTYVDNADVTLFENGIVHINSSQEETTTHLQNCEILWRFETEAEERINKVRLLKPKSEAVRSADKPGSDPETP